MNGSSHYRYHLPPVLLIVAVALLAGIPVLRFGIPLGHDAAEHLSWYQCFIAQLGAGELYPRWLQGMNGGLGSPDLFVYSPLPYYAAAVFHPFIGRGREIYDLGFSIAGAIIAAGLAAYFWFRQLAPERLIPALGALVYLGIPYYLKTDLYPRVALAEFWAFAWMPIILGFTHLTVRSRSRAAMAGLAAGWGLLFATHLFTTLLFLPVGLIYAFWLADPGQRLGSFFRACGGMLLGAALAAVYLLPALAYEKYISAYHLIETRPDYRFDQNFLFSTHTEFLDSLSRFTGWTAMVALLFFACAMLAKSHRTRWAGMFWAVTGAVSLLLMLPAGMWFWRNLPLLHDIQFPYRFNTLLTLGTAALAALGLESLREQRNWQKLILTGAAVILMLGWARPLARVLRSHHSPFYMPVKVDYLITAWANWTDPKLVSLRGISMPQDPPRVAPAKGAAIVNRWDPRRLEFTVVSESQEWVTVRQLYFPGWAAFLSDGRPLQLQPSTPEGLIRILVPAGTSKISLRLVRGIPEIAGWILSAGTAVFLIGLCFERPRARVEVPVLQETA